MKIEKLIKMAEKILISPSNDVIKSLELEYKDIQSRIEKMQQIDVTEITPMTRISKPVTWMREDIIKKNELNKRDLLSNSSSSDEDFVLIEKVF